MGATGTSLSLVMRPHWACDHMHEAYILHLAFRLHGHPAASPKQPGSDPVVQSDCQAKAWGQRAHVPFLGSIYVAPFFFFF